MTQFNDQDFYLAERAFKNKDADYFYWFKNAAVKRFEYLKPLLDEIKTKEMSLYDISYDLYQEVWQLEEIIQQEL